MISFVYMITFVEADWVERRGINTLRSQHPPVNNLSLREQKERDNDE